MRRHGPVDHFDLVRWAKRQSVESKLKRLEAHVLLLLATYANKEAEAWPSIRTLALDAGLKPTPDGRNSAISAALSRLQELELVWSKQGGHGHSAYRELLFDPDDHPGLTRRRARGDEPSPPNKVPSVSVESRPKTAVESLPAEPSGVADIQPSVPADPKSQLKNQDQVPEEEARGSLPATRKASHLAERKGSNGAERVRVPRPLGDVIADVLLDLAGEEA